MTDPIGNTSPETQLRIAAAADLHCHPGRRAETEAAFAALEGKADLILLAGDLTTYGEPEEAEVLAEACHSLSIPVFAVLGNHDYHAGRAPAVKAILEEGGITVLERGWAQCQVAGVDVGVVGTKGFVGGFGRCHLPDFGEPSLRDIYAETSAEVKAIEDGLHAVALCPIRIVLLHYAPISETLVGEPEGIWVFLGSDRLAAPLVEHTPDLVLHGHAHAGRFQGEVGGVSVFNVSAPVIGQDFWVFELSTPGRAASAIH